MAGILVAGVGAQEGPPFPRIANCYGVGLKPDSTPEDLDAIARFDLLIGGVWANWGDEGSRRLIAEKIAAVRERNPHIIVLDFSSSAPYAHPGDRTFPEDGWLLQPDGSHIQGWPGTEMITLTRPAVLDWLVARSVASVREKGFDGTFIDCMGGGFDWWACNIATREPYQVDADGDGKPDDREELNRRWIEAKTELSRRVREALGADGLFMTNQAGDWGYPHMNGILLEDWLDYVLDGRMDWDHVLQTYLRWTQAPHQPTLAAIVSSSGLEPPFNPWQTMSQEERTALLDRGRGLLDRMRFGLTTTLMGDGYFAYDLHTRWRGQRWWYPEYDAPLGYPKGPAQRQPDGTWRREFDGGSVVVNPTVFDAVVRLDGGHRDVSAGKVDTQFLVPARDGRIFLPTDAAATPGSLPDPTPRLTLDGPEPVVERDGRILVRLQGLAALFDAQGRMLQITDGSRAFVEGARASIVSDDQWREFAYQDCAHRVGPDGVLEFTGRRTEGAAELAFTQRVKAEGRALEISYSWRALSDLHVHMWRQQMDFPVGVFAGGAFQTGDATGELPVERSPQPNLASGFSRIAFTAPDGRGVTVAVSGEAGLVDERHYGVQAYRLGHYPARGDLKAGQQWQATFRIEAAAPR